MHLGKTQRAHRHSKRCKAEQVSLFTCFQITLARFGQDDTFFISLRNNSPPVKPNELLYRLDGNYVSELLMNSQP